MKSMMSWTTLVVAIVAMTGSVAFAKAECNSDSDCRAGQRCKKYNFRSEKKDGECGVLYDSQCVARDVVPRQVPVQANAVARDASSPTQAEPGQVTVSTSQCCAQPAPIINNYITMPEAAATATTSNNVVVRSEGNYDFRPQGVVGAYLPFTAFFVKRYNGEEAFDVGGALALGFNLNSPKMDIGLIVGGGASRHTNSRDGAGLVAGQLTLTWKPTENQKWFQIGIYGGFAVDVAGGGTRNWSAAVGPAVKFSFFCDRLAIVAGLGLAVGGTADGVPGIRGLSDMPPAGSQPALEWPGLNANLGVFGQFPGVCR